MSPNRSRNGRQLNRHHAQPEIEVFPEGPARTMPARSLFVAVISRTSADQGFVGPDPFEGAFPEEPQEFDLETGVDLADLVQKQRAALGLFDPADPPLVSSGKRPFSWPNNSLSRTVHVDSAARVHGDQAARARGLS
jgi:hypothetical protein